MSEGMERRPETMAFLLLAVIGAIIAIIVIHVSCEDCEAGTTYVEGDWYIREPTILSDGTWWVNGSVRIDGGALELVRAELVIDREADDFCSIIVADDGSLEATDSTIRGVDGDLFVRSNGDIRLYRTTVEGFDLDERGIDDTGQGLLLEGCTLRDGGTLVRASGALRAQDCLFEDFTTGVLVREEGGIPDPGRGPSAVVVENCTFRRAPGGTGVYLSSSTEGSGEQHDGTDPDVTVRRCRFEGLRMGIYISGEDGWVSLVEFNTATGCSAGAKIVLVGNRTVVHGNVWNVTGGPALELRIDDPDGPLVYSETIVGGDVGLRASGVRTTGRLTVGYATIIDSVVGVHATDLRLDLYRCEVSAEDVEFEAGDRGIVHLHDCEHTRSGRVLPGTGEIADIAMMNITSVEWQDGSCIGTGVVRFVHDRGYLSCVRDNADPKPVELATWHVTSGWAVGITTLRGEVQDGDVQFHSDPFEVPGSGWLQLVIVDEFVPEATLLTPSMNGLLFAGRFVGMDGTFYERGAGMGRVAVRTEGGTWADATLSGGVWNITLGPLEDGVHRTEVNITDRAGNSRQRAGVWFTTDATPPFIEVIEPAPTVNRRSVNLTARTEVGARAWVGDEEVRVGPDGLFRAVIDLYTGTNTMHITVADRAGNTNVTDHFVTYDVVPPYLRVDSPLEGAWLSVAAIEVTGVSEEDAVVTVDGVVAIRAGGAFSLLLPAGGEGGCTMHVRSRDLAGNEAVVVRSVRIDTIPPQLHINSEWTDGHVTNGDIILSGAVEDDGPVSVTAAGIRQVLAGNLWAVRLTLAEGENVIMVMAVDAASNVNSTIVRVTLDTRPPKASVTLLLDGSELPPGTEEFKTGCATARLMVEVDEAVHLVISGIGLFDALEGVSVYEVELGAGENEITVSMVDLAQNVGPSMSFEVFRDTVPPFLVVTGPNDGTRTGRPVITVTGWTEPGSDLSIAGRRVGLHDDGTFVATVVLEPGPNMINLTSTDRFGNEAAVTVTVHRQPPSEGPDAGPTFNSLALVIALSVLLLAAMGARRALRKG